MQLSETQRADIYALAKSGVDIEVIARDYHVSHTDIYRVLKNEPKKYTRFFKGERREEILEEYAKGTTIYELSRLFHTSTSTLKKHLINEGVYRKEEEKGQTEILSSEKEADFIERYKKGESLIHLMIEYGCYQSTLEKIILKHPELKRKKPAPAPEFLVENEQIIEDYLSGSSIKELAKKYQRNQGPIQTLLKKSGIYERIGIETQKEQEKQIEARTQRIETAMQTKINRRYEIECETKEEAQKLKDAILRAERLFQERETITIETEKQTVIVQGEVSYLFHNVMLRYFIDEEEN